MSESITVRFTLPVSARRIYDAWLDSREHSSMTGASATASRLVDGAFTAWDGYVTGKNLFLIENQKIVQSWRSSEFPDDAPDSVLSLRLIEREGLTEVELEHADIPAGQSVQYQSGWIEYYANPMQKYFAAGADKKNSRASRKVPGRNRPTRNRKPAAKAAAKRTAPATKGKAVKSRVAKRGKKSGRGKK